MNHGPSRHAHSRLIRRDCSFRSAASRLRADPGAVGRSWSSARANAALPGAMTMAAMQHRQQRSRFGCTFRHQGDRTSAQLGCETWTARLGRSGHVRAGATSALTSASTTEHSGSGAVPHIYLTHPSTSAAAKLGVQSYIRVGWGGVCRGGGGGGRGERGGPWTAGAHPGPQSPPPTAAAVPPVRHASSGSAISQPGDVRPALRPVRTAHTLAELSQPPQEYGTSADACCSASARALPDDLFV